MKRTPRTTKVDIARAGSALPVVDARWQVFLRVAAAGSLSKAAIALDTPQSIVSRQIGQLEQQCGERLFRRTGRGVVLTDFGHRLLPQVTRLVADAQALADDVLSARGEPAGEVRLGLLPSAVGLFAGPLFAASRASLPSVRLHFVEGASAFLEEQLQQDRLDLATVLREDAANVGDGHVLATTPLHLLGPRGDPRTTGDDIALAALAGLPLVVPSRPHLLRARLDRLAAERGIALTVAVEADSVHLQHEVVAAGGGYAIASVPHERLDPRLSAARIVDPVLERFVVLVESPRRPATRAMRSVQRLIGEIADAIEAPARGRHRQTG